MIHLSQTNANGFDELVFQNRNQAYGAYVLRREYPRNVLKSLLIGVALIASILAIPYLSNLMKKDEVVKDSLPQIDVIDIQKIEQKQDPVPDPVKPKGGPKPTANLITFMIPEITDKFVEDTMTTVDDFKDFSPASFNNHGNGLGGFIEGPGDGSVVIGDDDDKPVDIIFIEQMPEFPGGEAAMYKFLDDNIVYPEYARNIGLEGKVYVTFVVDQFGNLTHIDTPRPVGGGLDDEAARVVKIMPRWKPAKMNGRPVKVKYNLPIVFRLH